MCKLGRMTSLSYISGQPIGGISLLRRLPYSHTVERGTESKRKGTKQMSYNENAGLALAGELSAMNLLKLLSGSAKNNPIPPKYTGSRKALRELKKARNKA